jgi:hypothetical protein
MHPIRERRVPSVCGGVQGLIRESVTSARACVRGKVAAITRARVRRPIKTMATTLKSVVIGGDFNTNHDQAMFAAERTLDSLADAGYQNGFEALSLSQRVTHPRSHGFPDATFDFIFAKNLTASQPTITQTSCSCPRGVDLISDTLPFGRLWYREPDAIRQCNRLRKVLQPLT